MTTSTSQQRSGVETAAGPRPAAGTEPGRRRYFRLNRRWLRKQWPSLLLIPFTLMWVYPFLWMLSAAFKPTSEVLTGGLGLIPDEFTVDNFVHAWTVGNFGRYFINTVIISVAVVIIVVLVSSMAGYALGRGAMPGRKIIVGALIASMFLPHGYTIIPVYVLINLLDLNNTLTGVILAESGPAQVITILLFMGYFNGLPKEIEESARVDGAGYVRTYVSVMMPMARPVIGTVVLFTFIETWNSFFIPLVFTLARTDLRTLGVGIYGFFGEFGNEWGSIAAASVITVAPIVLVFLRVQKTFIQGIAGAIKG